MLKSKSDKDSFMSPGDIEGSVSGLEVLFHGEGTN